MSDHLLPALRRCRALFALALCGWLLAAGAAWAHGAGCASMPMPGMTIPADTSAGPAHCMPCGDHAHGDRPGDRHDPHASGDCRCLPAPADLAPPLIVIDAPSAAQTRWPSRIGPPPQTGHAPPLRPPLA